LSGKHPPEFRSSICLGRRVPVEFGLEVLGIRIIKQAT
jgi:hypothetical protein